ncbi:12150_t:CDS:10 [Acaulospora colombiana]|uniref:12150_t:CDS:1 n=1 Tax=Acaulospora colombiana TaxID=27376 RepID=A0ACA9LL53_9GLOM|nr:12150_t:CDS:10 [Acaulospora colombiana]
MKVQRRTKMMTATPPTKAIIKGRAVGGGELVVVGGEVLVLENGVGEFVEPSFASTLLLHQSTYGIASIGNCPSILGEHGYSTTLGPGTLGSDAGGFVIWATMSLMEETERVLYLIVFGLLNSLLNEWMAIWILHQPATRSGVLGRRSDIALLHMRDLGLGDTGTGLPDIPHRHWRTLFTSSVTQALDHQGALCPIARTWTRHTSTLLRLTPLLLLACILLALHSRLGSLTAAQPENKRKRFRLASRTVSDALNGHREETKYPLITEMGELLHAIIFTCMTYSILQLSRSMNGYLLLPDQVLVVITTRIVPLFIVRSIYCLIDTILPLAIHHRIRLFTPSIATSADGLVWVITFYTLLALANPAANWIGREAAHLVHGIRPVEPATSSTDVENGQVVNDQEHHEPNKWRFKLLSPFQKHHQYGSTDVREGDSPDQSHHRVPEERYNGPQDGRPAPLPDVAIINGVAGGRTQVYAQTHPMAPAWLVQAELRMTPFHGSLALDSKFEVGRSSGDEPALTCLENLHHGHLIVPESTKKERFISQMCIIFNSEPPRNLDWRAKVADLGSPILEARVSHSFWIMESSKADSHPPSKQEDEETILRAKKRYYRQCLFSLLWCFFAFGLNDGSLGPLIPAYQRYYRSDQLFKSESKPGISRASYNLVQLVTSFAVFLLGSGLALLNAHGNGFMSMLENSTEMGFAHASYGAGALVSPLIATQFSKHTDRKWAFHYMFLLGSTLISLSLILYTFKGKGYDDGVVEQVEMIVPPTLAEEEVRRQSSEEEGETTPAPPPPTNVKKVGMFATVMKQIPMHLMASFVFVYVGVEVTIGGEGEDHHPDTSTLASLEASMQWSSGIDRLTPWWQAWRQVASFSYGSINSGLIGTGRLEFTIWFVPSLIGNAVAVSFVGLVLGPMYPIVMSQAGRIIPRKLLPGSIGWISGFGGTGSAALPFVTGALAARWGIQSLQPL